MTATALAIAALVGLAVVGLGAAAVYSVVRGRRAGPALGGGTALARAVSYGGLALALAAAVALGLAGVAVLVLAISLVGLWEWARICGLPRHHLLAMLAADVIVIAAIYLNGTGAADWLVGGIVLVGSAWPVIRANTDRAVRDLGFAAIGMVFICVGLVHGVALARDWHESGVVMFAALAAGCAGSDIGAFIVGRRFGHAKLAPSLSPNKTRAGLAGNLVGAAVGLVPLAPALAVAFGQAGIPWWYGVLLVPVVGLGSVWGDLFKSAAKREAGVKDFGAWLPGFGGILDRVDSLLMTLPLAYWTLRVIVAAGLA